MTDEVKTKSCTPRTANLCLDSALDPVLPFVPAFGTLLHSREITEPSETSLLLITA